jgi:hypothetical protein
MNTASRLGLRRCAKELGKQQVETISSKKKEAIFRILSEHLLKTRCIVLNTA